MAELPEQMLEEPEMVGAGGLLKLVIKTESPKVLQVVASFKTLILYQPASETVI